MLQNVKDAKDIEQAIDMKSDAVTLGGEAQALHIDTDTTISDEVDMWSTPNSTPKTPTYHTHSNKRKRKLEDSVNTLVEHITKTATPTPAAEQTALQQLMLDMQKQQQQMMSAISVIQTQLAHIAPPATH